MISHFLKRMADVYGGPIEVSKVAIIYNGRLLVGKRTDDRKFDLPGGRLEEGETPEEAAIRETYEEAMVRVGSLQYLGSWKVSTKKGLHLVHGYIYKADKSIMPQASSEMTEWQWTDMHEDNEIFHPDVWHNVDDMMLKAMGLRGGSTAQGGEYDHD